MVSGLFAALLVVLFRLQVEQALVGVFKGAPEDFENLSPAWRFLVPMLGALLLGLLLRSIDKRYHAVGVLHVLERLRNHQGRLPGRNLLVQFFGGSIALITGQSVGREGPGVHLGAGIASLLGQWFDLPNNAMRTLIACGAAAAIAAAFNTPMAGVIFAMEVILMEYTILGFVPVIIASVLGSTVTQLVFGTEPLIVVPPVELNLLWEIPFMVYAGLLYAVAAVLFIRINLYAARWRDAPVVGRFLVIGVLTGAVAVFVPQILGAGYDTLNQLIAGSLSIRLLLVIVAAKLVVTAVSTGLGMLGGLIGPLLVIGGCLGGVLGVIGNGLVTEASSPGFYVVLGMVAMMGAVLNAPMAAMVTILELGNNPAIIFPSMLMVVVACVGVQWLFRCQGIFAEQLRAVGVTSYEEPARQFLSRIGVRSVMNSSLTLAPARISYQHALAIVNQAVVWIVIQHDDGDRQLVSAADLAKYLETRPRAEPGQQDPLAEEPGHTVMADSGESDSEHSPAELPAAADSSSETPAEQIALDRIPARLFNTAALDSKSNLYQASLAIQQDGVEALCITRRYGEGENVVGVLTRDAIQKFYGI